MWKILDAAFLQLAQRCLVMRIGKSSAERSYHCKEEGETHRQHLQAVTSRLTTLSEADACLADDAMTVSLSVSLLCLAITVCHALVRGLGLLPLPRLPSAFMLSTARSSCSASCLVDTYRTINFNYCIINDTNELGSSADIFGCRWEPTGSVSDAT
ncbi:hypothetical protein J6590_059071 [Homalodisca vitripennis]|nr:hypothetical protein J6590_059071 [Homalodisca vitripennis]